MSTAAGAAPEDPLLDALEAAASAVDGAAAAVSWRTQDAVVLDAVGRVAALRSRVEALYLDLVRQVDERGVATASPVATSPEGFLRTACLVGAGQARRDVAAARATARDRPLAPFAARLRDGRSTRAHVDVAVRCLDRIPAQVLARAGAPRRIVDYLEEAAAEAGPLDMDRAARQLLARLDPDAADHFDVDGHQRRFLDIHTDSTGMCVGRFQLDAVTGASLRTALDHFSAPEVGADGDPDRRQPRQRRADALAVLTETALGVATPRRGERPRVVVHVTPQQLAGASAGSATVEGDGPLSPASLGRLACDPVLQRVVMDPTAGPVDVGRAHRLVTLAQRRALEARDGGCVIPGCGAAAGWCDAHHVLPWAAGGPTDLHNLCLLCPGHHTAVHAGSWQVRCRGGSLVVVPPRWVDRSRTPRPVRHHRIRETLLDLDVDLDPDVDPGLQPDPRPGPPSDRTRPPPPPTSTSHVDLSVGPLVELMRAMVRDHAPAPPQ